MTQENTNKKEKLLDYSESLISAYTVFKEAFIDPKTVLYPSCGYDASPAKVFSDVTFLDLERGNEGCIDALVQEGYKAIKADVKTFKPEQAYDLLILQNPSVGVDSWVLDLVKQGGYVIANNTHKTATELNNMSEFELCGSIDFQNKNGDVYRNKAILSKDISDLFVPIEGEKENAFSFFSPKYKRNAEYFIFRRK